MVPALSSQSLQSALVRKGLSPAVALSIFLANRLSTPAIVLVEVATL
jgi:hypothetical protein